VNFLLLIDMITFSTEVIPRSLILAGYLTMTAFIG